MAKIQNISEIHPTFGFTEFDILERYRQSFHASELGKLHSVFPFERMAKATGLSEQRLGRRKLFSPSAKIALMVLKAYTGFSDRQLVEHLNGNIHYQMFCGILICPSFPITNYKIISAIRNEIGSRLDVDSLQEILASHWKPYLDNLHVCMADATCYESHMRFPTDMKILWESMEWLHRHICRHCRDLGIRRPRNKYADVAASYLSYCKKRKRKASKTRMLKRRMIRLLEKLISQRDGIHSRYGTALRYTQDYQKRLSIIRKVLIQEKELFEGRKSSGRIVSIDRYYIRPIVRGKETKSVEFGAKVNNIQIDGISFIEHLSFNAFNEGIRLKDCIRMQQKLMNVRVRYVAADSIYANNANRKFCTKYGISTSFVRKGRAAKDERLRKVLRSELSRERATRLEGSFGTQKQHYSLSRIKARNRKTEILWIFFGIHTANAVLMIDKFKNRPDKVA
ncbi:transposase [Parabacteroides distasonis]|uniref:transposase n=1 Tax=Parabacteroides distasonis TaxID=823 RepID=UPI0018A040B9|nr:transposase [Parabacteroides distasonis]MDB9152036.1 transposase [Parabacteroides distasonis]MDB9156591.1 transposase [Parabacteroides distasonis]MDB9167763.1 transposase [Parabacteroides distasonis]MDB9170124.1 transposase [Parabacteroides distasonis]MDB9195952.1 transposase [Parabacteroides distasonis]